MRRPPLIAIVALLALIGSAEGAGADSPVGADADTEVGVKFQLRAGGFVLGLENNADDDQDELTLVVRGHRQEVFYLVDGTVSRQGIEAKLGKLGEVSLGFRATKTVSTREPPRRCKGEPAQDLEGVFSGTFRFRGERGYVEAETSHVHGEMQIHPPRTCEPRRTASRLRVVPPAAGRREDTAVVSVLRRDPQLGFVAIAQRDPGERSTSFLAAAFESREGMHIYRYAYARARAAAFEFDLAAGTATVRPPWPFQGGARFRRGPHGHNSWTGSLRVRLLGTDPVDLVAPGFRATMKDEYQDE